MHWVVNKGEKEDIGKKQFAVKIKFAKIQDSYRRIKILYSCM